jgi:3D (Asp-Asp-Asp) domain-containing protein
MSKYLKLVHLAIAGGIAVGLVGCGLTGEVSCDPETDKWGDCAEIQGEASSSSVTTPSATSSSITPATSSSSKPSSSSVATSSATQPSSAGVSSSSISSTPKVIPDGTIVEVSCAVNAPIAEANCNCVRPVDLMSSTGDWPIYPNPLFVKLSDGSTNEIENHGNYGEKWIPKHPNSGFSTIKFGQNNMKMALNFAHENCASYNSAYGK